MSSYFIVILNMSLTASYVALGVIIARMLLKKAPKIFSYALWAIVLFRLVSPFSFESSFSLIPGKTEAISQDIIYSQNPAITTGIGMVDNVANQSIQFSLPPVKPWNSVNPMGIVMEIAAFIWMLGIALLLSYGMISYLRLKHRLSTATLVYENVYETDRIKTPFVLGFIKPKIYIPTELSESELNYILKHEKTHIRRLDYIIKPVAFLALILHWFNPLIWLSYFLMVKDMEMSCDESVMKQSSSDIRANYANSLLSLSAKQSGLLSPLAFGESSLKSRIKNVLNYKKPAFWVTIVAIAVVLVVSVGFMANPKEKNESLTNAARLLDYKTEYVGNASKVGKIISSLDYPHEVNYDHFELHTANIPYGTTVYLKIEEAIRANNSEVIRQELEKNAIIMFSLIDNVDFIRYAIWLDGEDHTFIFTREQVNERMGQDVRGFAQGEEEFADLLRMLKSVSTVEDADKQIGAKIEKNLSIILSSPNVSSRPGDYIKAHQDEYETIIKNSDDALNYLLQQFETGDNNDLRGHIMMILSKELLGDRNNVADETLLPQEWYSQLSIREEDKLPNFVYEGNNPVEKLVYDTEIKQNINPYQSGFVVVAPKVHAYYEEGNKIKVFVTTYYATYHLFGKVLTQGGAGVVPAAITYSKSSYGSYT